MNEVNPAWSLRGSYADAGTELRQVGIQLLLGIAPRVLLLPSIFISMDFAVRPRMNSPVIDQRLYCCLGCPPVFGSWLSHLVRQPSELQLLTCEVEISAGYLWHCVGHEPSMIYFRKSLHESGTAELLHHQRCTLPRRRVMPPSLRVFSAGLLLRSRRSGASKARAMPAVCVYEHA